MHVATSGSASARPVLFLHGGGVGGWMWDPVRALLGDEVRAIVPDLPGHDRSAGEPYRGHNATIDALVELLDAEGVTAGLTVVGFSLGAQLTVQLAAEHPHLVAHAIPISPQAIPFGRMTRRAGPEIRRSTARRPPEGGRADATAGGWGARATLALLRATAPLARNERFARLQGRELGVPAALMDDYLRASASMSADNLVAVVGANMAFTIPDAWSRFAGQVDVMVGAREQRIMHESAAAVHAALPTSTLTTVPDVGHAIPFDGPDLVVAALAMRG